MKVEFNQKKAISTATLGVSAGVGALVSKGAMSIAPASFKKPLTRILLGGVALVAASTIQGTGTLEVAAKGAALGVGIQQVAEGAIGFIKPSLPAVGENPTKAKQFIAGALAGADDAETFVLPQANMERRQVAQRQTVSGGINVI